MLYSNHTCFLLRRLLYSIWNSKIQKGLQGLSRSLYFWYQIASLTYFHHFQINSANLAVARHIDCSSIIQTKSIKCVCCDQLLTLDTSQLETNNKNGHDGVDNDFLALIDSILGPLSQEDSTLRVLVFHVWSLSRMQPFSNRSNISKVYDCDNVVIWRWQQGIVCNDFSDLFTCLRKYNVWDGGGIWNHEELFYAASCSQMLNL
jgi:hypothetical protein